LTTTAAIDTATASDIADLTEGLHDFLQRQVLPLEEQHRAVLDNPRLTYAESGAYSSDTVELFREVRMRSAAAGYYPMFAPENVGGGGLGALAQYTVWESLHHRYGPGRLLPYQSVGHWTSGPSFLLGHLSPALRDTITAEVMSGRASVCFAMSEPDAGSDAWSMSTSAVRDGDEWVINGSKQWISNSPFATYAFVFAVTDQELRRGRRSGVSCFIVPTDTPGYHVDSVIRLFGHIGGNEAILSFQDVRVSDEHLVGELHHGFDLALGGISRGRIYNAGRSVGLARWALERACEYATTRKAFGKVISDYQGVTFPLADSAMEIYASKQMSLDCARRIDAGEPALKELSMVKAYSTEMCFRVFDRCMQVHGGMGLTNEMNLVEGWHQARIVRVADGTGEVMRRNIASRILKGDLQF
jgi:acyl-CoA dehydrogenase